MEIMETPCLKKFIITFNCAICSICFLILFCKTIFETIIFTTSGNNIVTISDFN